MIAGLTRCHNIDDIRSLAARRLPSPMWDFLEGGAEHEFTLRRNTRAFDDYFLRPRVLMDVASVDLSTRVLGQEVSMPLMFSPAGGAGIWHPEAETAVAKAAAEAGIFYGISTGATKSLEDISMVGAGPRMFQLYAFKDEGINRQLVQRSKQSGCQALCLTVDAAAGAGNRERDARNGISPGSAMTWRSRISIACHPGWAFKVWRSRGSRLGMIESLMPSGRYSLQEIRQFLGQKMTASMTWKDAERIAKEWAGPFAIKGILTREDALRAISSGATAVIVSNHGGRQLDGVRAAIDALPEIADAVAGKAEVIVDGGVRRGAHIAKALALGATAVMVGRPYLYGLAAGGKPGVDLVVKILRSELKLTMGLLGATSIAQIDRSFVERTSVRSC